MAYKNPLDPRARVARRKHYAKNKQQYYNNNLIKKNRMREYLDKLKDVPCADCKKKFPTYCMDFDHRDMSDKMGGIGRILNGQSWKKLIAEVKKCDIVCANCHRLRTAKQLKWKDKVGSGNTILSKRIK